MLHPLDLLTYFERKFRSFHSSNEESAGQRAAKLPSAKREWNPGGVKPRHACTHFGCNGWSGRLFLWHPTLKASNFVALWPTDPILLAWKDPNLFDIHYTYYLVKRLAVFLRWVLLCKRDLIFIVFLVTACKRMSLTVYLLLKILMFKVIFERNWTTAYVCIKTSFQVDLAIEKIMNYTSCPLKCLKSSDQNFKEVFQKIKFYVAIWHNSYSISLKALIISKYQN